MIKYAVTLAAVACTSTAAFAGTVQESCVDDGCHICVDFYVDFDINQDVLEPNGEVYGPQVYGTLCWDPAQVPGGERESIDVNSGLLSVDVWVKNLLVADALGDPGAMHFDETDDIDYDQHPQAQFVGGYFDGLYFAFEIEPFVAYIEGGLFTLASSVIFDGLDDVLLQPILEGRVVYGDPYLVCEVIPTPAAAGAGLALMGLVAVSRRRRA